MSRSLYARLASRCRPQGFDKQRREFLRATLAASSGILASCAPARNSASGAVPHGRSVIVVGAGFSGLACAYELLSLGYSVKVFEARARVGGRVLSLRGTPPDSVVEAGGEFVGSNHPTWLAYAERFQLEFLDPADEEGLASPVQLDGRVLSKAEAQALFLEVDAALKQMTADAARVDADEPWLTPAASDLDRLATSTWLERLRLSRGAHALLTADLVGNNGVDLSAQSYLGNLAQVKGGGLERFWEESDAWRCRGGNDQLARRLAEAIGSQNLRLNCAVRKLLITDESVAVTCADGSTAHAQDAVLAVPPSVWNRIQIAPSLPPSLKPQMGKSVKYLAQVSSRFWRALGRQPSSVTDGMISATWEATSGQRGPAAVLTAFSSGPHAEACLRRWARENDGAYRSELELLYPGFQQEFVSSRFFAWPEEAWTEAGYSFPAPGQITAFGPTLREGIGRLHFAGEHTCYKFIGYMEGALDSGASLARRLAVRDGVAEPVRRAGPSVSDHFIRDSRMGLHT